MKKIIIILLFCFLQCLVSQSQNWSNMGFTMNRTPRTLYTDTISNLMYIGGGGFTYLDTNYIRGIAYWDGVTYHGMGFGIDYGGTPGNVLAITRYNNDIYVGGAFTAAGNQYSPNISKWNGVAWTVIGANGAVDGMTVYNNELYVCGVFDSIAGIAAHGIAKYNGTTWIALDCPVDIYSLASIAFFNGDMYVGGNFSDSTGAPMDIIKYNGSTWSNVGAGVPGLFASLFKLKVYKNELYAMGRFFTSDGNPSTSIMKWDGFNWLNVGNGVNGINPTITSCIELNNDLYVAGSFLSAGGVPASKIAKWDGTKWCASNSIFNANIDVIETYNSQLIVGGGFTKTDGDTMYYMAKWVGGSFGDTCSIAFTGVEQLSIDNALNLYPNPSSNQITVELSEASKQTTTLQIKNTLGQTIKTVPLTKGNKQLEIDISDLAQGFYFVQMQNGNRMISKKFIKSK